MRTPIPFICVLFGVFLPLLTPATVHAEIEKWQSDEAIITPQYVLESVWNHHPRLKQEVIMLKEANARALASVGAFDMTLNSNNRSYLDGYYTGNSVDTYVEVPIPAARGTLKGGYRAGRGEFPVYEDEYQTLDSGEVRLEGTISLLRNFSIDERRLALQLAELDTDIAELSVTSAKLLLGQAALEQFWNWVLLDKIQQIYAQLLAVAEERQKQLDARVKAGDLAAFEALDNQRTILQRKSLLVRQSAAVKQAARTLSLFLRDDSGSPLVPKQQQIPKRLPQPISMSMSTDTLLKMAQDNRPDFRSLQIQIKQLQETNKFLESRFLPELTLGGIAARDYGDGASSRDGTEIKMYLGLEVPLQQRRNRGNLVETTSKLQRMRVARTFLREQVENQIALSLIDLEQTQQRHALSIEERDTTLLLAKGELERFKTGDSNLLFLNIREVSAAEAEVKVYEALRESLVRGVALAASIGDFDLLLHK
jgi:outer membrane protein TolC